MPCIHGVFEMINDIIDIQPWVYLENKRCSITGIPVDVGQ